MDVDSWIDVAVSRLDTLSQHDLIRGVKETEETEMAQLKRMISTFQAMIDESIGTIKELTTILKSKDDELEQKSFEIKNLEESVFAREERIKELNNLLGTEKLDEKNLTVENYETDLSDFECQNLCLSNTLETENYSKFENMQMTMNKLTHDIRSLQEEESNLNDKITLNSELIKEIHMFSLKEENFILNINNSSKDAILAALENHIKSNKAEIDSLLADKLSISDELGMLKIEYKAQLTKNVNLEIKILEYRSIVKALEKEVLSSNSVIADLQNEIYKLKHLPFDNEEQTDEAKIVSTPV